jgi:hypothetical protein
MLSMRTEDSKAAADQLGDDSPMGTFAAPGLVTQEQIVTSIGGTARVDLTHHHPDS